MIVDYDLAVTSITGDKALTAGKSTVYDVTLENKGTKDITSGEVRLSDNEGNILATKGITETIAAGTTATLSIEWIPTTAVSAVTATSYVDNDLISSNDSYSKGVYVINEDEFFVETESDGSHPTLMPFAFEGVSFTFAQTIYRPEELNISNGMINGISYHYTNNDKTVADRHIKVYLANSESGNILDGWTDAAEMTLVFDGYVDFKNGSNILHIPFDAPFEYNGQNLRVITEKLDDTTYADIRFNAKNFGNEVRTAIYSGEKYTVNYNSIEGSSMLNEIILRVKNIETDIDMTNVNSVINLANGKLTIDRNADSIEVYNISGMLVTSALNTNQLDINMLGQGSYIIKVKHGNEEMIKKMIIK